MTFMNIHGLTWIGLFIIFIGTALTIWGQQIISSRDSKLLQEKSDKIQILAEKNVALSQENSELNKTITATVTGGDSYCYLYFFPPKGEQKSCDLMLFTEGEYPLYDVSIKIEDVKKLVNMVLEDKKAGLLPYRSLTESKKRFDETETIINIGNIPPSSSRLLGSIRIPEGDSISYNINIVTRNGYFTQVVRFHLVNGEWKKAMRLMGHEKLLKENIDKDFPRNQDGNVEW
jgi:hypothetical protein